MLVDGFGLMIWIGGGGVVGSGDGSGVDCMIDSGIGSGVGGGGSSMIGSGIEGSSMTSLKFFLCLSRYCFWYSFLCATLSSSVAN